MPNFSPCRKRACNRQGEFMPALESSCSGVIGWDASPVRNVFYEICQWIKWFLQWFLLPSSIQAVHCHATLNLPYPSERTHSPTSPSKSFLQINSHGTSVRLSTFLCPFVIWPARSLETVLLQGFTEISLDRGQLWSENLRQENRGALIFGAHQSL